MEARPAGCSPRRRRLPSSAGCLQALGVVLAASCARAEAPLTLTLKLQVGGEVFGEVLDATDELIVVDYLGAVCAFAYDELQVASAYQAKRKLLMRERGHPEALTAEDHFALGRYALRRDRPVLANVEFKEAQRLDAAFGGRIAAAREKYRDRRKAGRAGAERSPLQEDIPPSGQTALPGLTETIQRVGSQERARIIELYKRFGQSVREEINPDLVLIETDHFLIWTDWKRHRREALGDWCERMYAALSAQLGLDPAGNIFLGKCPVFCFRSKARFLRFGRTYDNWQITSANGYTRTARNGHVHMVVYRRAPSPYETERFAGTLVHEGTHAFLHRYGRTGHVGGWVGEGLAEYMAEQVLADRCLYGEATELVARQYVRRNIPIGNLLRTTGLPKPHEYRIAHSLVGFLIERDSAAFAQLIADLKRGYRVEAALRRNYDGMTFGTLEASWREHVGTEG